MKPERKCFREHARSDRGNRIDHAAIAAEHVVRQRDDLDWAMGGVEEVEPAARQHPLPRPWQRRRAAARPALRPGRRHVLPGAAATGLPVGNRVTTFLSNGRAGSPFPPRCW